LQVVAGTAEGRFVDRGRFNVSAASGAEGIRAELSATLLALIEKHQPRAIGVGYGGPINWRTGRIVKSYHVAGWQGFPLGQWLAELSKLPVFVENDANVAALGEALVGAGRGCSPVFYVTVGSGVGGEIGHITVERAGIRCGCGNRGCLETVATDSAFVREMSHLLGKSVGINEAIDAIRSGRVDSAAVVERTVDYMAIAVAAVINVFNPSTLFLHGKLLGSDQAIFNRVLAEGGRRTLKPSFADCRILQSQGNKRLGAVAGIIRNLADEMAPSMAWFEPGGAKTISASERQ
jgi:predicted NBD/HSP70 family sugar kinase